MLQQGEELASCSVAVRRRIDGGIESILLLGIGISRQLISMTDVLIKTPPEWGAVPK